MELAKPLEAPVEQRSPLAVLRLRRELTVEEAARRAGLSPGQIEWLEDGDLHRFPDGQAAVLAVLRYSTSLGVGHPARPRRLGRRLAVIAAAALLAAGLAAVIVVAIGRAGPNGQHRSATLPPPAHVPVDVLNGRGDADSTKKLVGRIRSLGYRIERVAKAGRTTGGPTGVYFEPGGQALAQRLAAQLGCEMISPLPGGHNPHRLVVIAGPASSAC